MMKGNAMKTKCIVLLFGLTMIAFVVGCVDDNSMIWLSGTAEFEVIQASLDAYIDSNKEPTISANALFDNLKMDARDDPVVLSVRSADHYAIGHIPGAINIPWRQIAESESLEMLPTDRQIVVYCNTGHIGGVVATALNAMGYDAVNMEFGIVSWTLDTEVRGGAAFSEDTDAHDFPVESTGNAPGSYELADPHYTDSQDEAEIVRAAVEAYVADKEPTISAEALYDNLYDEDASNDPVVLSVRSADHYAIGHIPGAINIPWYQIAERESLEMLPTDRQIVVYCYTGHTSAVATTALNMLGYDAVNLEFGIMSWTRDTETRGTAAFSDRTVCPSR